MIKINILFSEPVNSLFIDKNCTKQSICYEVLELHVLRPHSSRYIISTCNTFMMHKTPYLLVRILFQRVPRFLGLKFTELLYIETERLKKIL